jgi:hypothetical protein
MFIRAGRGAKKVVNLLNSLHEIKKARFRKTLLV